MLYIMNNMNDICSAWISVFLENLQKSPSGLCIAARRHIMFFYFWVLAKGIAWRHIPDRQTTLSKSPSFSGFGWSAWQ